MWLPILISPYLSQQPLTPESICIFAAHIEANSVVCKANKMTVSQMCYKNTGSIEINVLSWVR